MKRRAVDSANKSIKGKGSFNLRWDHTDATTDYDMKMGKKYVWPVLDVDDTKSWHTYILFRVFGVSFYIICLLVYFALKITTNVLQQVITFDKLLSKNIF